MSSKLDLALVGKQQERFLSENGLILIHESVLCVDPGNIAGLFLYCTDGKGTIIFLWLKS